MEDLYRQLISVLYGMWQRRWYAVAVAWFFCLAGWGAVATLPDQYESYARIYIDTDPMLRPLMRGISVDVNVMSQIEVMQRTLKSRPNLSKVVRMTDLDLTVQNERQMEALLTGLEKNVEVASQGGNLVRVAYENSDPQLAKRVVQALMTIFVETNLGRSRKDLAGARRFIDEQIREYELELNAAEKRLSDFKRDNMGFLPGENNYFTQMANARRNYEMERAKLDELIIRRNELQRQLAAIPQYLTVTTPLGPMAAGGPFGEGGSTGIAGASTSAPARVKSLEQTLANLLLRYTERHPDVVGVKKELDLLRNASLTTENGDAESAGSGAAIISAGNTTISNSVYEQTKLEIIDLEAQIKVGVPRVQKVNDEFNDLKKMAQTVPVVEAELSRLNRDYGVIKRNYEEMLGRREKARIEQSIETKSDKVIYNMIEPPQVPVKPSSPNRPLFLSIVLVVALGSGTGLAFVLSQISATFATVQSLRESFALPVLGAVTALVAETDRRKDLLGYSMFAVTFLGLLLTYGGVLALELHQAK